MDGPDALECADGPDALECAEQYSVPRHHARSVKRVLLRQAREKALLRQARKGALLRQARKKVLLRQARGKVSPAAAGMYLSPNSNLSHFPYLPQTHDPNFSRET